MQYKSAAASSAGNDTGVARAAGEHEGWHNWRVFHITAWAGFVLACCSAVVLALQGRWVDVAVMTGFTLTAVVVLLVNRRLPTLVELLVIVAALLNAAGYVWDLYAAWGPFDKVVHGYTLFVLTLPLGLLARGRLLHGERDHRLWFIVVVASFGVALGALWEVGEWLFDLMMPGNVIQGKTDTITDIVVDTIGALAAGWLCYEIVSRRATQEEPHS